MSLRSACTFLLLGFPLCASAQKDSAKFTLYLQGKPVGHDEYTLQQSAKGPKLNSRFTFRYRVPGVDGGSSAQVSVDISDEFRFDPTFLDLDGVSENMDDHFRNSFVPNKPRTELTLTDQNYSGSQNSDTAPVGPNLLVLTNFDPGTAQAALNYVLAHPTAGSAYSVFIPGKSASAAEAPASSGGRGTHATAAPDSDAKITLDAKWSKLSDTTGQLDGKPIPVHVFQLAAPRNSWIFYTDESNLLLQLNILPLRAACVRSGFHLDPPVPATAPQSK